MSHDSYLSGYIVLNDKKEKAIDAIDRLPEYSEDDDWPFLTKGMFSITTDPSYREPIIHFAASYKDILGSWKDWEQKFEVVIGAFKYLDIRIIIEDCYHGMFMATWNYEPIPIAEGGGDKLVKRKRHINYKKGAEVEFQSS